MPAKLCKSEWHGEGDTEYRTHDQGNFEGVKVLSMNYNKENVLMTQPEPFTQKSWQKKAWVQWLAVAIGILPYIIAFFFPKQAQPFNV